MALINLRNALMTGKRLPYDNEVEYLESTGTQWIDTGIKPGPNTRVEIVFAMTTFTANCGLFGARGNATADNNSYNLFIISNSGARVRWDWSGSGQYQTSEADTSTVATYVLGAAGGTITRNGATVMSVSASKAAINYPLYVFNFNNVGTPYSTGANARFWSVKIYDGQTLVFDAIPVRKGSTGYLYDRVSGKLFGNAGTGDFVVGQDVVPVEWLQTDGLAYIDTGVPVNSNLRVRAKFESRMTTNTTKWFFLGRDNAVAGDGFGFGVLNGYATSDYNGRISSQIDKFPTGTVVVIDKNKFDCSYNNHSLINTSTTFSYTSHLPIWGLISTGSFVTNATLTSRCYYFNIDDDGNPIRRFLSVRVGTEGAMMDTLTRRIYRNAGTGAFGYGNDLKYPISAS